MKAEAHKGETNTDPVVERPGVVPVLDFSGETRLVGTVAGEVLPVDLDKLLASRLLIQAESGGGKSWMVRYLCEQTFGLLPHVLFDVEGDFHTLREKFPYVLVSATPGEGDLPADPRTARSLCRRLAELGASVILDLFDLEEDDQHEFARAYMGELLSLDRSLWTPRLVIVDEAETLAPEKGATASKAAVAALVKRARKRQMGVALAIQRLSDLSKRAAGGLQNKLLGFTSLDTDMRRAADTLGFDRSRRAVLEELPPGQFFAYGPAIGASGVVRVRSGEVLTTHEPRPKAAGPAPAAPPAPDSLKRILDELGDLSEAPDDEASDEAELRARIADLEGQLREAKKDGAAGRPTRSEIEKELRRKFEHSHRRELAEEAEKARVLEGRVFALQAVQAEASEQARRLVDILTADTAAVPGEAATGEKNAARSRRGPRTGSAKGPPARRSDGEPQNDAGENVRGDSAAAPDGEGVKGAARGRDGKRRILGALAHLEDLGISPVPRATLAAYADFKPSKSGGSGSFREHLARLGREELILSEGGGVRLAPSGREEAARQGESYGGPRSLSEFYERLMSGLPQKAAEMLRVVIARHPDWISRQELVEECGVTLNGTTRRYLADFGRLGLVASKGGRVKATERLFPEGLA